MFVQDEERGQACEDGFEGEEDGGVGGGEMLLGPALDGEGGCCGEKAGDGERDNEAWSDGKVRSSAQWQGDRHDKSGDADLQSRKLAGGNSVRGVRQSEEMASEGNSAGKSEEISRANADEEVLQGGPRRRCQKEKAGEGEKSSHRCSPAWRRCVSGAERRDNGEEWDEDDNQAGDESGLRRRRASEPRRLELIAGCEEETNYRAREQSVTTDMTELAIVDDDQSEERQGHSEKIEEKW
jgi:hypothetical protein